MRRLSTETLQFQLAHVVRFHRAPEVLLDIAAPDDIGAADSDPPRVGAVDTRGSGLHDPLDIARPTVVVAPAPVTSVLHR